MSTYRYEVERRLIPALGDVPLQRLTAAHLRSFYADMQASGQTASTIRHTHAVLAAALGDAVGDKLIRTSPAAGFRLPQPAPVDRGAWSADQLAMWIAESDRDARWWLPVMVAALTGARRSEVCGIRWDSVAADFAAVTFRRALVAAHGDLHDQPHTKNRKPRTVPLPAPLPDLLHEHRRAQLERRLAVGADWCQVEGGGWVFAGPHGEAPRPMGMTAWFRRECGRLALPPIQMRHLRHTAATLLLRGGTDVRTVAAILGHDPAITLRVYAQDVAEAKEAALDGLAQRVVR